MVSRRSYALANPVAGLLDKEPKDFKRQDFLKLI